MEKSSEKIYKKFSSQMQARLLLVFCVITILLAGLIGRLIYIMQTDGERYAKQVLSRQAYVSSVLPYKRGDILDRNGTVLARSELQYRLILDPKNLLLNSDKIPATLEALNKHFEIEADSVNQILKDSPGSQYKILLKNLKLPEVNGFKDLMKENTDIKSLWFEEEYIRAYPYGSIGCDIIGFTSSDNTGFWGMEEYYNDELNGTNGREYGYYDSTLNIERIVKKPENGHSIISTIDVNAQRIIQKHISQFNTEFGSENLGILVMNPNNGEILAMAMNEEYDLNSPRSLEGIYPAEELAAMTPEDKILALNKLWKNDAISTGFEPGSTFKPFTVSAGLEEAMVSESTTFLCDGGEEVGGWEIDCSNRRGHGILTLGESLMKSCNDAMMQIAALEGKNIFSRYQNSFSFGQKTGIDLPGEEAGIVTSGDKIGPADLATYSFGQNFTVTMVQMAAAYSSLVNGGKYYQPHVVKEIINDAGATVKEIDPLLIRQTVSEETSDFIQKYMYQTVELGTAQPAKVPGYAIGGKTGTAEKYPRGEGTYLVSFLGAVPAINPEIVIYVIIDEPQNVVKQDDSSLATKLASRIMTELLPALGIFPEGEIDYLLPKEEEIGENETDDAAAGQSNEGENSDAVNPQDDQANTENQENSSSQAGDNQPAENSDENIRDQDDTEENTPEDDGDTEENDSEGTGDEVDPEDNDEDGNSSYVRRGEGAQENSSPEFELTNE